MNVTPMTSTPKGVSFMVHRLGTEVGPLKQVRELLINAFEAIEAYKKVIAGTEDLNLKARAFGNMGYAYRSLGNEAEAEKCFRAAASLGE